MASRSSIRTQVHISIGGCCHEKNCQPHWEFRVQWVCPRRHWHVDSWSWDSNHLSISNFIFQSPANTTPSHSNWPQPKVSDQPASSWVLSDPLHWLFQGISYCWSCYSNETDLPLGTFLTTWVGRPVLHFRDVWKRHIKPGNINQAGLQAAVRDSWGSGIKMCIPKKRRKGGSCCGTRGKSTDNDDKGYRQPQQRCRTHLLHTCRNSSRNCHSGIGVFSQAGDTNPTIDC